MANCSYALQEKALNLAEKIRVQVPGFYYGFLVQGDSIKPGVCFRGNREYAEISLCQFGTLHMTSAIHLSAKDDGYCMYIIYQQDKSEWLSREECVDMVKALAQMGIAMQNKHYNDTMDDWFINGITDESLLVKACQYIVNKLGDKEYIKRNKPTSLLYNEETFLRLLQKHLGSTIRQEDDGRLTYIQPTQQEVAENDADDDVDLSLEYPVANYITQFDGQTFTYEELVQQLRELGKQEDLGKVLGIHIFGMLFPEQIGTKSKQLANDAFGQESFFAEIQKGIRIGQHLRTLIRDGFSPVGTASRDEQYRKYLRALRTKPFMLLAGISGTGKSRIVRELAYRCCPDIDDMRSDSTTPGNYLMVEVKPNWHDSTELLGYYSNISGAYHFTKFVMFLVKALKYPSVPFFVCLDEMNLAPVEQYFAEFLSVLETRRHVGKTISTGKLVEAKYMKELAGWTKGDLTLPENVFIIGTVNMDDTTHQFSRKVIDRAMTVEMNGDKLDKMFGHSADLSYSNSVWTMDDLKCNYVNADEMLEKHPQGQAAIKQELVGFLDEVNLHLKDTPYTISYRVLNELCIYLGNVLDDEKTKDKDRFQQLMKESEDWIMLMKILPRIEGDNEMFAIKDDPKNRLEKLMEVAKDCPESLKKLEEMNKRLTTGGFTRFWP